MRLWLDDIRPAPPGWEWARSAARAIKLLAAGGVVEISLDHDLGSDFEPPVATGYDVAAWIEEQAHAGTLAPLRWAVHSANPVGAARIRQAMENADRDWLERAEREWKERSA